MRFQKGHTTGTSLNVACIAVSCSEYHIRDCPSSSALKKLDCNFEVTATRLKSRNGASHLWNGGYSASCIGKSVRYVLVQSGNDILGLHLAWHAWLGWPKIWLLVDLNTVVLSLCILSTPIFSYFSDDCFSF